jgi:chaperonin GroES
VHCVRSSCSRAVGRSGTEVKIDGEDLLIMKESDILGVLEDSVAKKKAA